MELNGNVQVKPIGIQNIPCKPLYFQTIDVQKVCDSRKEEIGKNREQKSLKFLSKGLKKKRHRNKKLDKALWDPSIQIPDLGNLTKYLKKKMRIAGITDVKEHRNPSIKGRRVGNIGLSKDCLGMNKHRSEPENTFDVIFPNEAFPGNDPQSAKESSVVEMPTFASPHVSTPASWENINPLEGDLGTPETFRLKVVNNYEQPLALANMDEMEEISFFPPELSSLERLSSDLSNNLPEQAPSINADTPIEDDSESKIIADQCVQEYRAESSDLVHELHPQTSSSGVEEIPLSKQTEMFKLQRESYSRIETVSPQIFDGFPGVVTSSEEENQNLFLSERPIEMLVIRLESDPFPRPGRKNAKVVVTRRAFSMDDAMMECWLSKSLNGVDGVSCPSGSAEQAHNISQIECLTNNVGNDPHCGISAARSTGTSRVSGDEKNFGPNPTTADLPGNPTNSIRNGNSAPREVDEGTMVPAFMDGSCPRESGTKPLITDVSDNNSTNYNNSLSESFLHEESLTLGHGNTKNEGENLVQAPGIEQENVTQIAEVHSEKSSMSNMDGGVIEETQSVDTENVNGESEDSGDSSLQLMVSSVSDIIAIDDGLKELHDSITKEKNKVCNSIDGPTTLQTSSQNFCEDSDVLNLNLDLPALPPTEKESDEVSAGVDVTDIGVIRLDPNSQKTLAVVQAVALGPSIDQSLLKNRLTLDTSSTCTPQSSDEIEECLEDVSKCSSDETQVSIRNSTSVSALQSEKSYESDDIGILRNDIQVHPAGARNIGLCTGSVKVSISGDESEKNEETSVESEECSEDAAYYVSDHNSTYVVDAYGHSEERHNCDPVDLIHRETILERSSDPPQDDSSADIIHTTGDEPEKCESTCAEVTEGKADTTFEDRGDDLDFGDESCVTPLQHWVLPAGKKFRRSLSIIRNLDDHHCTAVQRGRHYEKSVEEIIKLQGSIDDGTPIQSLRQRLSLRRSSWFRQMTPPPVKRNTFIWSPPVPDRCTLYETPHPRRSVYLTPMQQNVVRRSSVRTSPLVAPRRSIRNSFSQNCSPESPAQYTIRDLILTICKQNAPCCFDDVLNENAFKGGCKLGEGVFGEVFSINRDGNYTVLKIIPIEGLDLINGEKQKTYSEVLSELIIAKVLHELRYEGSDNLTSGFAELISTSLVQGCYPESLLEFWQEFDQSKGSDNDNPKVFGEEQLFIVMEQGNGGKDLESYAFSSAKQSLSIFKQIAFSLAVAEISVEFEHRDLHWGNILVSKTSEKQIYFHLNGSRYSVASSGVKSTIIDYTLSRIKYVNQFPIYNDIGKDPEMFIATGDYQFDVYRLMKKDVDDEWSRFAPKTNVRWLHYLQDKIRTKVKYQRKTAKVHKDSMRVLEEIGSWIEECGSALSVALRMADMKN